GTLLLYERKLGYVILLVGSLLGTGVPIIHMMGAGLVGGRIGHTHLALFWVFSNFLLGVTALFSVILSVRGLWSLRRTTPSMRRPVSVKPFFHFFFFFFISSLSKLFPSSQAASVATLPSALFVERLSLGASWVYSIQSVLLPDYRPLPPF